MCPPAGLKRPDGLWGQAHGPAPTKNALTNYNYGMFVLLSMGESQTHFKFKLSLANEFDFAKRRPVLMAAFIPGEKNGLIKLNILDVVDAEVPVVSKERRSNHHFVINAVTRNVTDQV